MSRIPACLREATAITRPFKALTISDEERDELHNWLRKHRMPAAEQQRARMTLLSTEGLPAREIGERVGVSAETVGNSSRIWPASLYFTPVIGVRCPLSAVRGVSLGHDGLVICVDGELDVIAGAPLSLFGRRRIGVNIVLGFALMTHFNLALIGDWPAL